MIIGSFNTHVWRIGKYSFHEFNFFFLLILIAVTMPFFIQVNSIFILLLALNWVVEGDWIEKGRRLINSRYALIWIVFFLFHAISIVYSTYKREAQFELEKKFSFLAFPLILSTTTFLTRSKLAIILKSFVLACLVASLLCLGNAFFYYLKGDTSFFFYHKLSSPLAFHAVYFSMYIGFCLFILIQYLMTDYHQLSRTFRFFIVALIVLFMVFLILLSSKTIIITVFLILICYAIMQLIKEKRKWVGLSLVTISAIFLITLILKTPYVHNRFKEIYNENYSALLQKNDYRNFHFTGGTIRLAIWKSVFEVLSEENAWLFGVGIGDAQTLLTAHYIKKNIYPGDELLGFKGFTHYNAHNQYLQFMITLGLAGLLFFIFALGFSFYVAIKNKEAIFVSILMLFSAFCFTESVLCAHKGVVFFLFFNSLYCTLLSKTSR